MSKRDSSMICLFDVDGTLTPARQTITEDVATYLTKLKEKCLVGLVGGSDFVKIAEQMGAKSNDELTSKFDYVFAENGLVAYRGTEKIGQQNLQKYVGDEVLQKLINFALGYMSKINLPCKRGTFVEFRSSMINLCPIGRSCSQAERDEFVRFEQENDVRKQFVAALYKEFPDAGLTFAIGGQISIDVFPNGWDKTYCLQYLAKDNVKTVHFFGDKTAKGGNDHEIFEDSRTIGHTVKNPQDTLDQLEQLMK